MAKREIPFDTKVVEAEENLLVDYQFLLQERMSAKGLSQADLAERAGISNARLSQIMGDHANPTVKTFAGLFYALGERVCVSSEPLSESEEGQQPQKSTETSKWEWARPVRADKLITEEMIAMVKNSATVMDEGSMASNDNYTRHRISYLSSEVATALALEPEAEAA